MFKLIANEGAPTSAPAITKQKIKIGETYKKGCLYFLTDKGLEKNYAFVNDIRYVSLEDATGSQEKDTLTCFRVTPNMVFEADAPENPGSIGTGIVVSFAKDSNGNTNGISATEGDDAMIINMEKHKALHKADVLLMW